jgi:glycosyltransferase involved in cell wall biosynthesis
MNIDTPHTPISFGICVGPNPNIDWLAKCVDSIRTQGIPKYEIIIVSNEFVDLESHLKIAEENPDNSIRMAVRKDWWLPKKKNYIASIAKNDILCIVHDYYLFDDLWYDGVRECIETNRHYNKPWDILSAYVLRLEDEERGPDWVINPFYLKRYLDDPKNQDMLEELRRLYPLENHPMYVVGLGPFEERLLPLQYISGGYIMCKKQVLLEVPFDETMVVGQPEDVEWSERVMKHPNNFSLRFNPFSIVYTQKPNKWKVYPLLEGHIKRLREAIDNGFFNHVS